MRGKASPRPTVRQAPRGDPVRRPDILNSLFREISSLSGVGPRFQKLYEKLCGPRVADLLWHLPSGLIDRSYRPKVASAEPGRIATLLVTVLMHRKPANRRMPYKVVCEDETGGLDLVFFHGREDWLNKQLPVDQKRAISGKVEFFQGRPQITHPDHIVPESELEEIGGVEPTYPLTTGLTPKVVAKTVAAALGDIPDLPEWHEKRLAAQEGWHSWQQSIRAAHTPQSRMDLDPETPARRRLAYDELLANQVALSLIRNHHRQTKGRAFIGDGSLTDRVEAALPYGLTGAQRQALGEIRADMAQPGRMLRLLQGDVGSGKTVVALLTMLTVVEAGCQAAIMAPTEILARQHLESVAPLLLPLGIKPVLLTGRDKGKARQAALLEIAEGRTPIVIGTHALFQEGVEFRDLGVAVIDEQHRFGVHQRMMLADKGKGVDILVMTATPIPRTLTLTAYGDMDVSRLDEKPPGRKPVKTVTIPDNRYEEVEDAVGRQLANGAKVYWVCPLVEESDVLDVTAAEERHRALAQRFGADRVGLVHGKLKGPEKDKVMAAFAEGDLALLVATTVIEVGVNVPSATVMVIEHAERFGLAQLHQLRGRVGRGEKPSTCLLLYKQPLGDVAKERLKIMRDSEDGFLIAEKDLELRGGGEVLGTRQSGLPGFRLVEPGAHRDLMELAQNDTRHLLTIDPSLDSERGQAIRTLLYLFERDQAVRLLRSG
ncbi:MAG: ATP-dependent DNA helicase RecG [Alphaproteobacteria bacterium]|nr:ATP-dependent DNA helicase RecG [Alphaproteobacteria bacterium]